MGYLVKTDGQTMHVLTDLFGRASHRKDFTAGEQLMDFAYYNLTQLHDALDRIFSFAVNFRNPDESLLRAIKRLYDENIYIGFVAELFLEALTSNNWKKKDGFESLCKQYLREIEMVKSDERFASVNYRNADKPFLIGVFSSHALSLQWFVRSQLEFCMNSSGNKLYTDLTPSQRLYVYEMWRREGGELPLYFDTDTFPYRLIMDKAVEIPSGASIETMAEAVKKVNPDISPRIDFDNAYSLIRYEFMQMITLNVPVKLCANCERYFIPGGRIDAEYCTRIAPGQTEKTCQAIGALQKHKNKVKDNVIHQEYHKAYKRQNSRLRNKGLTVKEFSEWSENARELRDKCISGSMAQEEYFNWLNQDRIYKRRD